MIRTMTNSSMRADGVLWAERIALMVGLGIYLYALQSDAPNGDGQVYMRQIEAGRVVWNPNHLLMEPIGLWAFRLMRAVGLDWSLFGVLKVLSACAAVVSTGLFHATLSAVPEASRAHRVLGTAGLALSAHFLSMAIAEEFYMVQMPVVTAALLLGVWWTTEPAASQRARHLLIGLGGLSALATAISINNAFLALALGAAVALPATNGGRWRPSNALWVWGSGLALSLPLFIGAYATSTSSGPGVIRWMVSYQGESEGPSGGLYGIVPTPAGVATSLATLAYGMVTSVVPLGELGSFAESLARSRPLEFRPDISHLASRIALFLCLGLLALPFVSWLLRTGRRTPIGALALTWLAGYLLFNFLWVDTSDQFWFQLLPAVWLLLVLFSAEARRAGALVAPRRGVTLRRWALPILAVLLAWTNTMSVAVPRAYADIEGKRERLQQLLRPTDLVITPGWDGQVWLTASESRGRDRVVLMDLALRSRAGEKGMEELPTRIREHLAGGHRVIVARVFDLDREGRPWEEMARLRWPRNRVKTLLSEFDHSVIGQVDHVVLRNLTLRERAR
jgi:hypothetical protein